MNNVIFLFKVLSKQYLKIIGKIDINTLFFFSILTNKKDKTFRQHLSFINETQTCDLTVWKSGDPT